LFHVITCLAEYRCTANPNPGRVMALTASSAGTGSPDHTPFFLHNHVFICSLLTCLVEYRCTANPMPGRVMALTASSAGTGSTDHTFSCLHNYLFHVVFAHLPGRVAMHGQSDPRLLDGPYRLLGRHGLP
jgi:hypothetical protein